MWFFFFNYHKDYRIQVSNSVMGGEPIRVGAFLSTTVLGLPYLEFRKRVCDLFLFHSHSFC